MALQVFQMRGGSIQSRRQFTFQSVGFERQSFYPAILVQYYSDESSIPDNIYVPVSFKESTLTEKMLSDLKGNKVRIIIPSRGRKKDFLRMVERNAKLLFEARFRKEMRSREKGLEELEKIIDAPLPLERIDAFDVSHMQGSDAVAGVVVFEDGKPAKKHYRRFKIKASAKSADDYASLSEAIHRRYKRILEEKARLPDFILVDGGKGQLSAARSALEMIGIGHLIAGSFEKRGEKLFLSSRSAPVLMEKSSAPLNLIRKIRDEAHRFAIAYHRKLRTRRTIRSELTDIPGIGRKTAEKLLRNFGSVSGLRKARFEEVARITSRKVAQAVQNHFS